MATYSKKLLSGSTNGKQIKVATTATTGTLIHTAISGTSVFDEVWIYAVNSDITISHKLTIQWGETTSPDSNVEITVSPESGYVLVIPGLLLQNGLSVRAFADTANVVLVNGYINRIA